MKHSFWLIIFCSITSISFSQKNELTVRAGTGFYYFSGKSAGKNIPEYYTMYYPDPALRTYGNKPEFSFTAGFNFKRVTKGTLLYGVGVEYQSLSSRSNIHADSVVPSPFSSLVIPVETEGKVVFNGQFITLMPFFGKRFKTGKNSLDLTAGPELGFVLKGVRKTYLTDVPNVNWERKRTIETNDLDFRMQLQLEMNFSRFGVYTGYAHGFSNYYKQMIGYQPEAYSHFFRLGMEYRLK